MRSVIKSLAAAAFGVAMMAMPAKAVVNIYDLGAIAAPGSTHYVGTTGTGAISEFFKFFIGLSPSNTSVSYSDSVTISGDAITGGSVRIYSCSSDCTGTLSVPTGSLIASAAFVNVTPTVQVAGFGPLFLLSSGFYFLEIVGSTTASSGVAYDGTIAVSAVPEPATWAMMLIGFAGLGYAARRRKAA